MTVYSCILSLPGMRRKKKSRKLAKIHVHHKYSVNMLSITRSQRNQKVLITRMKDKPEQNPNKGSSSACVSERCWNSHSDAQHISLLGLQWTGFVFLVFFWASENVTSFGFVVLVYTRIPMWIPCLRLPATLHLKITWGPLLPSFGWYYGQARLRGESLVKLIDFRASQAAKIKRRDLTVRTCFFPPILYQAEIGCLKVWPIFYSTIVPQAALADVAQTPWSEYSQLKSPKWTGSHARSRDAGTMLSHRTASLETCPPPQPYPTEK